MDIYKKIVNVMKKVSFIPKETEVIMKRGKYTAVSHDTVARLLHPILTEEGIIVKVCLDESSHETRAIGEFEQVFYRGVYTIYLIAASDGSSLTYRVESHAIDSSDKAPGKALSYAVKMALLKAFVLESGDEDEARPDAVVRHISKPDLAHKTAEQRPSGTKITPQQIMEIRELSAKTGTKIHDLLKFAGVDRLEDIETSRYDAIIDIFEKKMRKMANSE